jgi:hypothetical protein
VAKISAAALLSSPWLACGNFVEAVAVSTFSPLGAGV